MLRERCQFVRINRRTMCDASSIGLFSIDDDDRRIGNDIAVKRGCVHHVHIGFEMKVIGNKLPQRTAIAVFHPTIGTDETKRPLRGKALQRTLDKWDVNISAIIYGMVPCAIFCHQRVRDQFLPNVRRIADHKVELAVQLDQKKVAEDQPLIGKTFRSASGDPSFRKMRNDCGTRFAIAVAM